jgi:drug/metabolite transporter (DMT)-like permease
VTPRQGALLGLLAAIWGASYLLIKYALEDFSAAEVVFLRTLVATLVLLVVIRWQRGTNWAALRGTAKRPGVALLLGFTAVAVPFVLITVGEKTVPSGLTAVLIAPASLFVAAFAPFIDRSEAIDRREAGGLIAGLFGVGLLVGVETVSSLEQFLGALGILAASAFYALSSFVVKGPFRGVPAIVSSAVSVGLGAAMTLPFALLTLSTDTPGLRAILSVVALGAVGTALAFVIFYRLIAEIGAGRASLVSYLAPGVALFYGAVFLDEPITWAAIVGLTLILGGVFVAGRSRPAEKSVQPHGEPHGCLDEIPAISGDSRPE